MSGWLIEQDAITGLLLNQKIPALIFDDGCNRDIGFPDHDPLKAFLKSKPGALRNVFYPLDRRKEMMSRRAYNIWESPRSDNLIGIRLEYRIQEFFEYSVPRTAH
jgi:hypothetical protein